ncbi:MAG TPA: hypothetical protein VHM93_01675 [Candidatus Acidoferrum sp.]|nr:hypothetical protein [Candidatus Acidoferrum sp.]
MIKHFAANTADPALRYSVLPRAPNAGADGFDGTGLEKVDNITADLCVTVEEEVAVGTRQRQSFAQLLAKSEGFQGEFVTWQKKGPQVSCYRTG